MFEEFGDNGLMIIVVIAVIVIALMLMAGKKKTESKPAATAPVLGELPPLSTTPPVEGSGVISLGDQY